MIGWTWKDVAFVHMATMFQALGLALLAEAYEEKTSKGLN